MKTRKTLALCFVFMDLSGCGSFGAMIMHGPTCPYQGVKLDAWVATDWSTVKDTYGAIIPLAIVDLPFSFIIDTFTLDKANGGGLCPRDFQ